MALPQVIPSSDLTVYPNIDDIVVRPRIVVSSPPLNPFDNLPIELTQRIAEHLESDVSVCAFQATCRSARDAIAGDNDSFWRRRFLTHFDPTNWSQIENVKYKDAYHHRRRVLKNGATFRNGRGRDERECLEVLRDLVVGAFTPDTAASASTIARRKLLDEDLASHPRSKNIRSLIKFLESSNLLTTIFKPAPRRNGNSSSFSFRSEPLLHTIRVICAPLLLSLNEHLINGHFGFPDSQLAVYSAARSRPFFGTSRATGGAEVDMELVLHHLNFWRYHMVRKAEQTLFPAFFALNEDERPQWWRDPLSSHQGETSLGRHWKASYAYLNHDDLAALRAGAADDDYDAQQIQDIFAGEDTGLPFQDMRLRGVQHGRKHFWPPAFERALKALTPPAATSAAAMGVRTRAQKRSQAPATAEEKTSAPLSIRFDGCGTDGEENFRADGWLGPLPAQQGVPGWRRLTMMKYYLLDEEKGEVDGDEGEEREIDEGNVDWHGLWAYEGVVLPGGRVVVGRWWSVDPWADEEGEDGEGEEPEPQYSGPFVLWCVDGEGADGV